MGRLKKKITSNLYTQNYLQSGGGHDFPVYKGKGGNVMHVYRGRGGGFGTRILGRFVKPFIKNIFKTVKHEAVKKIKKHVIPIGKKVAKRAIESGLEETKNVMSGKKKMKQAIKDLGKKTKQHAKEETVKHMRGGGNVKVKRIGKKRRNDVFSRLPVIKNVRK